MAVHPPIIFAGYALLAVPFVYSIESMIKNPMDGDFLIPMRRWTLIAWAFLGAGIFIGGYWAYKVLGWGGYWGWDPVENSSLVPWLLACVLLHLISVARERCGAFYLVHLAAILSFAGRSSRAAAFLAISPFTPSRARRSDSISPLQMQLCCSSASAF